MTKILQLINDIGEVTRLAEWVEQLSEECQLPPDKTFQLNLALEEAVVNVINYAYPGRQGMPVMLTADILPGCIHFVLDDEGVPFDPTQAEDPDITLSAEDRPIGGLGIMLVRQFMSDITYHRVEGHNRLSMAMRY